MPVDAPPAWTRRDLNADPHAAADKADRVRRMFSAIAGRYDLNNRVHSMGRDQAWRRAAVRAASLEPGDAVVDVACGTGDLSLAFRKAGATRVLGLDFTVPMLHHAVKKNPDHADHRASPVAMPPAYAAADALQLPLADACCEVLSIAFGIRNVIDPAKAFAEFYRVLRPGGRVVVLEFSEPKNALIRMGSRVWTNGIMPYTASLIAGDKSGAYHYLPRSVDAFLTADELAAALTHAGFRDVQQTPQTFGVATIHRAVR